MRGDHAGAQLAPVSGESAKGHELLPAFFALSHAIESHRCKYLLQAAKVDAQGGEPRSFAVIVQGVRCRVQHVQDERYHIRVSSNLLPFSRLGMPEGLKARLMSNELDSGGLVVVCGSFGSGKTSTVNAVVRARVESRGGYALMLGHPIEHDMRGFHGSLAVPGFIEQVDLVGMDLRAEIRASMRNFPAGAVSILSYPELIGFDGVGEMLRAANRGNLVFADMHALNIEASILNLVTMGEQDGENYARDLLGNSLRLVIHQRMIAAPTASQGLSVSFSSVAINASMRAALADRSMPLWRAITGVLASPGQA